VLAKVEMTASISGTAAAVYCAAAGFGPWTLLVALLTTAIVKTAILLFIGLRRFRPAFHFQRANLKGYISFGLFQMGERTINYIAERLDQILIGPILGAQALGFYNFALYLTAQPVWRINPILTKVAFPVFSRVQHDPERLRSGYLKLLRLIATVNAPLLVGLAAIAPWAIPDIFGPRWSASIVLVQILAFVSLSRSLGNPIGSLQLARGRADLGFWWNLLLFVCSIPTVYVGARLGQATGVAVSLLILHLCINIPAYLLLVRPLIGHCARDYVSATARPVLLALAMGAAVIALPALASGLPVRLEVATQVLLGAVVYGALVRITDQAAIAEFRAVLASR
jgi:O-antigen/teichoic acid export membrane protein